MPPLLGKASLCLSVSCAVDKRIESEESGDEEGRKQAVRLVTELSQQSLRDEQNGENSAGTVSASALPPGVPAACAQPAAPPVLLLAGYPWEPALEPASWKLNKFVARIKLPAFYGTASIRALLFFYFFPPCLFTHPCFSLKYLMSKCKVSLFTFSFMEIQKLYVEIFSLEVIMRSFS